MPNAKPAKSLDILGNLGLAPERNLDFYLDSKLQSAFFGKKPNADSVGSDNIELFALQNDREHKFMLQIQGEMVEHAALQKTINSGRIAELTKMYDKLKNRFIETNRLLIDCDEKKNFSEGKVLEEKRIQAELRNIMQNHRKDLEVLKKFREDLGNTVQEFEAYESVIEEVVNSSNLNLYSSGKDCMDRCDALMMTQVEISEMKAKKMQAIEVLRHEMVRFTNEAALAVLGLKNELNEMQRGYAHACSQCVKWEKILVGIKNAISDNQQLVIQTIDAIFNMYRDLCKRNGKTVKFKKNDIGRQMDYIRGEIKILTGVAQECEKKQTVAGK